MAEMSPERAGVASAAAVDGEIELLIVLPDGEHSAYLIGPVAGRSLHLLLGEALRELADATQAMPSLPPPDSDLPVREPWRMPSLERHGEVSYHNRPPWADFTTADWTYIAVAALALLIALAAFVVGAS